MSLTTSITSYWKMDESSGNASDSVASHTLTNNNVTYGTGIIHNGAVFNSTTDSLVTSTITDFNFSGATAFSFQAWTNQTTLANDGYIIAHIQSTANFPGYVFQVRSTGEVVFYIGQDNGGGNVLYLTSPAGSITTGAWYHIVVTYDGTKTPGGTHVYVNAVDKSLTTVFNNFSGSSAYSGTFQIGSRESNSINFAGTIDEVGIWARVLSAGEVTQLYNGGVGLQYPFTTSAGNFLSLL